MMAYLRRLVSGRGYEYSAVPEPDSPVRRYGRGPWGERRRRPVVLVLGAVVSFTILYFVFSHR